MFIDSPTYHSSRVARGLNNAQAPTSRVLVVYSPLFPLGLGRGLRTRETVLSVLVSQTLIPVFGSETVVLRAVRKNTRGFPGFYQPGREIEFGGCLPVVQYSAVQYSTVQYKYSTWSVL